VRDQLGQPPLHSSRVWQFEFPCKFARDGRFCHRLSLTLQLNAPVYFDDTIDAPTRHTPIEAVDHSNIRNGPRDWRSSE
jgi:hypothetical protein